MNKSFLQLLIILFLALTACGPSQVELDATATQAAADLSGTQTALAPTATPTFTSTPTATATATSSPTATSTPTNTPTITPTPLPQWMSAGLTLEDLPDGFRVMNDQEMNPLRQNLPQNSIAFGFSNDATSQVVMGYFISYETEAEQTSFDGMLTDMLELYASAYGATTTPEAISGLDDLGETRAGSTFVAGSGPVDLRWENIVFRRDKIGVFLFIVYPDGDEPAVPSGDFARLMDERLSLSLSIWQDNFDGALLEPWEWINENPERWNLTEHPGFLRIYLSPLKFPEENGLRRLVAQGDFTIRTHLIFEPDTNYQFAGLVIYQDADNILAFGRAFCGNPEGCVGNGIYFDNARNGVLEGGNFATAVDSPNEAHLRLERRENNFTGFFSSDGITWIEIGTHHVPSDFEVNGVGLIAANDLNTPDREIPADFDFFELSENE